MRNVRGVSAAATLAAALLLGAAPPAATDPATFVGRWDAERTVDQLMGSIAVHDAGATLGDLSATGIAAGATRVYRFSSGRGELRVTTVRGERVAFWVQPQTVNGAAYATPVQVQATATGGYRGDVAPLPNRLTMSLYLQRDAGGTVDAFIRDPLYNVGRAYRTMTVTENGGTLKLAGQGPALTATIVDPNTLSLALPAFDPQPLTFKRHTETDPPLDATYRLPTTTGDGWASAAASDVKISRERLESLTRLAAGGPPTSVTSPAVHSLLIARHRKLVFDRYFAGFDETTLHDTRSAGKTYADVLAGAAMQVGVHLSAQTPLLPLYARYGSLANPDPRKARITLGDALSMSTGLDCDDNDEHSAANEDNMQNQTAQLDWYRLVLDARMVRDPGTKAVYCSASINLAGGAIAAAAHVWLPALFARYVAEPLQMQRYALNLTPTGDWYLGGGAYVRPRDFLKIGQAFLDGGIWHGHRIVPQAWVARSWSTHLALGPGDDYGFAWHMRSYSVGGTAYRVYEAQGNGGQILDVMPQLDLAVMLTQGNYNNFGTWGRMRDALVTGVIEAVEDK